MYEPQCMYVSLQICKFNLDIHLLQCTSIVEAYFTDQFTKLI